MASGDAPDGKIFVSLPPVDPKSNLLTLKNFVWRVELSGVSDTHCPRYLIPSDFNGDTPHPILRPLEGEATIYLAHIDVGLDFPFCEPLEDICKYYGIACKCGWVFESCTSLGVGTIL